MNYDQNKIDEEIKLISNSISLCFLQNLIDFFSGMGAQAALRLMVFSRDPFPDKASKHH